MSPRDSKTLLANLRRRAARLRGRTNLLRAALAGFARRVMDGIRIVKKS